MVRSSIAARGATQAAAAGAARWPHHLKRQERSREPRSSGGLGRRREAGAELPRWRERRERRRRNAGRAGDGPGLPRAPCTHRRASAGRCVRPSRPVFVISPAPIRKGRGARLRLWSVGRLPTRPELGVSGAGSARSFPAGSPSSRVYPCAAVAGRLRPGALPRRAGLRKCSEPAAVRAGLGIRSAEIGGAGAPPDSGHSSLGRG